MFAHETPSAPVLFTIDLNVLFQDIKPRHSLKQRNPPAGKAADHKTQQHFTARIWIEISSSKGAPRKRHVITDRPQFS